jgi:hypothetical protein
MFLFRAFDMYVVKLLGGHPKDIILYSASNNKLWAIHAASMVAFGAHANCAVSVSAFILLYYRC